MVIGGAFYRLIELFGIKGFVGRRGFVYWGFGVGLIIGVVPI
jgi:hypothetical protein